MRYLSVVSVLCCVPAVDERSREVYRTLSNELLQTVSNKKVFQKLKKGPPKKKKIKYTVCYNFYVWNIFTVLPCHQTAFSDEKQL